MGEVLKVWGVWSDSWSAEVGVGGEDGALERGLVKNKMQKNQSTQTLPR